jgi:hypothetical protein
LKEGKTVIGGVSLLLILALYFFSSKE